MTGYVELDADGTVAADVEPASGAEILDRVHAALTRYVAFPSPEAADAATLWTAATHGQPAWEHAARLVATSPAPRCGKSRLMDVVAEMCHSPLITVNSTVAATFRSIGDDPPTLLVDEADALFGTKKAAENNEDLRALINAGHQRNRPCRRCVGPSQIPKDFNTFSMVMLASIGDLPDTVMDRAVVVRMRRRAPAEHVDPFRTRRDRPALNELRGHLAGWIRANADELREAVPEMPVEDRAADTWEALVAIGDLAGGDWPDRARQAAKVLTDAAADDAAEASLGLVLLADLRTIFEEATVLYTTTILERLHELEEAPWADVFGKPLDSRGLARRLRPYGVRSRDVREGGIGDQRKGYRADDLHPVWERYLSPGVSATSATSATSQVNPTLIDGDVADTSATSDPSATGVTRGVAHVADVADTPPGFRRCASCNELVHEAVGDAHVCSGAVW